jgi:LysR family transcriptional activator of nhaA
VVCREADLETLLAELAVHRLDLVISDRPIPVGFGVKAYNHQLGESAIGFFAARSKAARYRKSFPQSLNGAPVILPLHNTALRRELDHWFEQIDVRPHIVAECDDSALIKVLGSAASSTRRCWISSRGVGVGQFFGTVQAAGIGDAAVAQ